MISAVLILRDCEKTIEACLNSIKDKVQEIICVIDTRSSDNTMQVILKWSESNNLNVTCPCKGRFTDRGGIVRESKLNIEIYDYEWKEQDYSKPRNYGIEP